MLRTNNKHSQQHQWFLIPHATLATGDSFRNIGETQVIQLICTEYSRYHPSSPIIHIGDISMCVQQQQAELLILLFLHHVV